VTHHNLAKYFNSPT